MAQCLRDKEIPENAFGAKERRAAAADGNQRVILFNSGRARCEHLRSARETRAWIRQRKVVIQGPAFHLQMLLASRVPLGFEVKLNVAPGVNLR